MRSVPLLALAALAMSCSTLPGGSAGPDAPGSAPATVAITPDTVPALRFSPGSAGKAFESMVAGDVTRVADNGDGTSTVYLSTQAAYYLGDERRTVDYELVVGSLEAAREAGPVEQGDGLGTLTDSSFVTAIVDGDDPYVLSSAKAPPVPVNGQYWASPDWLLPTTFIPLSFRYVESFDAAMEDFYRRWASEDEAQAVGSTIHYFPNLDRICVRLTLDEYPRPVRRTAALGMTEREFYGKVGLFATESPMPSELEYTPVLYWQRGFVEYLEKEYVLGDDIYVYCSAYTLDHENRRLVVCVRDFTLVSPERIVELRREAAGERSKAP